MFASKTTRQARDSNTGTFGMGFLDESGTGAGPYDPIHASVDSVGALIDPASRQDIASVVTSLGSEGSVFPFAAGQSGVRGLLAALIAKVGGVLTFQQFIGGVAISPTNRMPVEIDADNVTLSLPAGLAQDASLQTLISDVASNHSDLVAIHGDTGTTLHNDLQSLLTKLGTKLSVSIDGDSITLTMPAGLAQDGVDATGIGQPTGGSGIRGWLSGIYSAAAQTLSSISALQIATSVGKANRVVLVDPVTGNGSLVTAFHNADNQAIGSTSYGLMTGGVDQLINGSGNLDRKRAVSGDGMALTGVEATGCLLWNGTNFDRQYGDKTSGAWVNVKGMPAVTLAAGTAAIGSVTISSGSIGVTSMPAVGLAAGAAIIGKVGLDQSTPGTTNGVVVNSGTVTANIGTIAGLATATAQATMVTALQQLHTDLQAATPAGTNAIGSVLNLATAFVDRSGTTSATVNGFTVLAAANTARQYLRVTNTSSSVLYLWDKGGTPTVAGSVPVQPGQAIVFDAKVSNSTIQIAGSAASLTYEAAEG